MNTRAKFVVESITKNSKMYGSVRLRAVHSSDVNTEDHAFQTATPSGTIEMSLSGSGTQVEFFQTGDNFYVDFTKID